jgi:hypothetical protein
MTPAWLMVAIAAAGALVTVATVIYLAGRLEGVVSTRLQDIERRLHEIEHALARLGFTFRGQPLTRTDTE